MLKEGQDVWDLKPRKKKPYASDLGQNKWIGLDPVTGDNQWVHVVQTALGLKQLIDVLATC